MAEIARKWRRSVRTVERRLKAAREAEAEAEAESREPYRPPFWVHSIVPLFPIGPFTPESVCAHKGPIQPGSRFYCPVCHQSGFDGHPHLRRDPRTEPKPEPKPPASAKPPRAKTRREKRADRRRGAAF